MIRRACPDDAERIAGWLSDATTNRLLTANLRGATLSARLVQVALRRPDQAWFVFFDPSSGGDSAPVGLVALDNIEKTDDVANLWFVLGERTLGRRGLTSDAIGRLCDDNPLSLKVVTAWAAGTNSASIRCLERAGFDRIGEIPGAVTLEDGSVTSRVIFARDLVRKQCGNQS